MRSAPASEPPYRFVDMEGDTARAYAVEACDALVRLTARYKCKDRGLPHGQRVNCRMHFLGLARARALQMQCQSILQVSTRSGLTGLPLRHTLAPVGVPRRGRYRAALATGDESNGCRCASCRAPTDPAEGQGLSALDEAAGDGVSDLGSRDLFGLQRSRYARVCASRRAHWDAAREGSFLTALRNVLMHAGLSEGAAAHLTARRIRHGVREYAVRRPRCRP